MFNESRRGDTRYYCNSGGQDKMKLKYQCNRCWYEIEFKIRKEHYHKNITFSCKNCSKLYVYYSDGETVTVKERN